MDRRHLAHALADVRYLLSTRFWKYFAGKKCGICVDAHERLRDCCDCGYHEGMMNVDERLLAAEHGVARASQRRRPS